MNKEIRYCRICEKEIKTMMKCMGVNRRNLSWNQNRWIRDSEEGIQFSLDYHNGGVWFCNQCWNEIIKKIKYNKIL